ncbi:hypothetical protein QAD02_018717 [Eretmocerus hayati]|uniref:Uncharacterized protein n=1 Tax=Eretmocerus hayati TaxID=131215 RepID=A0ACC2PHM7_9HYME|nr:hypothetical protein QAD02_018717 [Eretmocerus hayati]
MDPIRVLIFKRGVTYDDLVISPDYLCQRSDHIKDVETDEGGLCVDSGVKRNTYLIKLRDQGIDAFLVSLYIYTLCRSEIYRKSVYLLFQSLARSKTMSNSVDSSVILIRLQKSRYNLIDYNWNERITRMVWERQEIDHAMSWLSTLGGAFSALGDQFDRCAKVAGKISVEQFKLSIRLGDPQLVARCKLYAALSLLQQGHYKASKTMIKDIYRFGVHDKDVRLQRMCQGVWAKLKYCYSHRTKKKKTTWKHQS